MASSTCSAPSPPISSAWTSRWAIGRASLATAGGCLPRAAVAIGIGLSGLAGAALAPIYSIHPGMGFGFVFKAFAVIIIGGLGNISGAAIAAVALGVLESVAGGFLPPSTVDAVAFIAM